MALDPKQQRRDQILEAAQRVFIEKGYTAAGIADIATELGIGHGTFYRYFKNKHDIALAVLDRVLETLGQAGFVEDPEASDTLDEYREQVRRILTRLLTTVRAQPRILLFFQQQGLVIDPSRMARFKELFSAWNSRFLANGVNKGFLVADLDIQPTSEALVSLIFEGVAKSIESDDHTLADRWLEAGMRLMFDGIAARRDR